MPGVADNPIDSSADDLLDRGDIAAAIAANIRHVDASQGYVLGVLGPWGSGKTSLVNLVREQLADAPSLPVLNFNPWMFSGAEQLIDSFFNELAAQLRLRGDRFEGIADRLDSYSELLTPLTWIPVAGSLIGMIKETVGAAKKISDKRKSGVEKRRQELSAELKKLDGPIFVVLDDIDRLTTSEIREIFKLVRLTASFPNVIYLLAFDRRRVEKALTEEGIDGRDYLEKIVQTVIDIPPVPQPLLLTTLGDALDEALSDASSAQRFDSDRWPDVLFEIIWPRVKNMRDIRRLAASIFTTVRQLGDEVELVDVLGLEAIRIFMPDTFSAIAAGREGLTKTTELGSGSRSDSSPEKLQVLAVVEAATAESSPAAAHAIIERLFPAGLQHTGNTSYGFDWDRRWLRERRVANKDVLQLYLERAANEDFTAFRAAEQALALAHDALRFEEYFTGVDPSKLEKTIASLEVYEGEFPEEAIVPMCTVLLNIMPTIPERPRGMLDLMDNRLIVGRVVLRALRQLAGPEVVRAAVTEILPNLRSLGGKSELVYTVGHLEGVGHKLVYEEVAAGYERELALAVEAADPEDLASESDLLRLLLFAEKTLGHTPLNVAEATPSLIIALLQSSKSEVRSQSFDSRAVRRSSRLAWDILVRLFGDETKLKDALDQTRGLEDAPDGYDETLALADKYINGWRPE